MSLMSVLSQNQFSYISWDTLNWTVSTQGAQYYFPVHIIISCYPNIDLFHFFSRLLYSTFYYISIIYFEIYFEINEALDF